MNENILLSICIPTYNRAEILKVSLFRLVEEANKLDDKSKIEIFVSDNCSTDNTKNVVNNFIEQGAHVKYSRNKVNVGSNGNFLKCIEKASGKYIWLLGDDDPLTNDSIKTILDIIEYDDYGLIHINNKATNNKNNIVYNDKEKFLEYVSFWITFMSANIFRSEIVMSIENPEQYLNTWLVQVPFFISSALSKEKNIVVNDRILDKPLASVTNGGYNIFEVFVKNIFDLWLFFVDKGRITNKCFKIIKKDTYHNFLYERIFEHLIMRKNINKINLDKNNGFYIDNAWNYLFDYYHSDMYFYISVILLPFYIIKSKISQILKKHVRNATH